MYLHGLQKPWQKLQAYYCCIDQTLFAQRSPNCRIGWESLFGLDDVLTPSSVLDNYGEYPICFRDLKELNGLANNAKVFHFQCISEWFTMRKAKNAFILHYV